MPKCAYTTWTPTSILWTGTGNPSVSHSSIAVVLDAGAGGRCSCAGGGTFSRRTSDLGEAAAEETGVSVVFAGGDSSVDSVGLFLYGRWIIGRTVPSLQTSGHIAVHHDHRSLAFFSPAGPRRRRARTGSLRGSSRSFRVISDRFSRIDPRKTAGGGSGSSGSVILSRRERAECSSLVPSFCGSWRGGAVAGGGPRTEVGDPHVAVGGGTLACRGGRDGRSWRDRGKPTICGSLARKTKRSCENLNRGYEGETNASVTWSVIVRKGDCRKIVVHHAKEVQRGVCITRRKIMMYSLDVGKSCLDGDDELLT